MKKEDIEKPKRAVRDLEFARRLSGACDDHAHVPPYNFGRLKWIREHLKADFSVSVSMETVRKWFAGEARPRPDKMRKLATMLNVDEAWLSLGIAPEMGRQERKSFNTSATGAVNMVAGLIELNGGRTAFPNEGDERTRNTNLGAIIKGVGHAFYVTLGYPTNQHPEEYRFTYPPKRTDVIILGVVHSSALACDFIRFPDEALDAHEIKKGGHAEIIACREGALYQVGKFCCETVNTFAKSLL
jgi:hypothetical protein